MLAPHAVGIAVIISSLIASPCFTFAEPFEDIFLFVKSSCALVSRNTSLRTQTYFRLSLVSAEKYVFFGGDMGISKLDLLCHLQFQAIQSERPGTGQKERMERTISVRKFRLGILVHLSRNFVFPGNFPFGKTKLVFPFTLQPKFSGFFL